MSAKDVDDSKWNETEFFRQEIARLGVEVDELRFANKFNSPAIIVVYCALGYLIWKQLS